MKTIGLIGGMSWKSTIPYYEIINTYIMNKLGGLHSAKIFLSSIDFFSLENLQKNHKWQDAGNLILKEALRLQDAGSDFILICSNTGNECVNRIQDRLQIPIIHIVTPLGEEIKSRGYKKVGLLGTKYTMEGEYITKALKDEYGVEVIIPDKVDREIMNRIIYQELCIGIFSPDSKYKYLKIIEKMAGKNIDSVILGCTEIQLLINQEDVTIPLLDTTELHAIFAAKKSLEEEK